MTAESEVRRGRHCVLNPHVHLVFVAKYCRRLFDGPAIERLREIFGVVCRDFEARLVEMDGEDDHVHLLVEYPTESLRLRPREQPQGCLQPGPATGPPGNRTKRCCWKGVLWSPRYFAASRGGAPIAIVRQYIEQQQRSD